MTENKEKQLKVLDVTELTNALQSGSVAELVPGKSYILHVKAKGVEEQHLRDIKDQLHSLTGAPALVCCTAPEEELILYAVKADLDPDTP